MINDDIREETVYTTKDRIPPVDNVDKYGRGIADEDRERRSIAKEVEEEEEETVFVFVSTLY